MSENCAERRSIKIQDDQYASSFVRDKLSKFKAIQKSEDYLGVWFADDFVIKRYTDKDRFHKAVRMQTKLFAETPLITCELIDTWVSYGNDQEWFTVSRNGGLSCEELPYTKDNEDKIALVRIALWNMGLVLFDDHPGNYVIDGNGVCRVIDYESIQDANTLV